MRDISNKIKKHIVDTTKLPQTATAKSLIWWATMLTADEQAQLAHSYKAETSFNLTVRDICEIHSRESELKHEAEANTMLVIKVKGSNTYYDYNNNGTIVWTGKPESAKTFKSIVTATYCIAVNKIEDCEVVPLPKTSRQVVESSPCGESRIGPWCSTCEAKGEC